VRLAVFSDIHAHADALDAVLHAAVAARVDALWCLGDMLGTGPDAAHVVGRVRSFCALALLGNHDYDVAARAALSPDDLEWMRRRRPAARREGVQCWHGSPRQPVREYVTAANAAACLAVQREPLGLVGHTHAPAAFREGARKPVAIGAPLPPRGEWWDSLDADPHADWLELDLGERTATWHRTPFDPGPCRARARQLSE
jgi:predicted phosphodiesterase